MWEDSKWGVAGHKAASHRRGVPSERGVAAELPKMAHDKGPAKVTKRKKISIKMANGGAASQQKGDSRAIRQRCHEIFTNF